jgi:Cu-Zn family superoxide dismutase
MKRILFTAGFFLLFATGCQNTPKKNKEAQIIRKTVKKVQFQLDPKSASTTQGDVTLTEEDGKVTFEANISGLSQGVHAIHIHQKADCSSDDGKSSGGHWNPTFEDHGAWGSETGFHRGDIGNFNADASGNGKVVFSTDLWCLDCDDPVKNLMGKAVIVHQGKDDLVSQPSGAAGARVSCAGIIY